MFKPVAFLCGASLLWTLLAMSLPRVDSACFFGTAAVNFASTNTSASAICSNSVGQSTCCSWEDLLAINQTLLNFQILTGDNLNSCYRDMQRMLCARCSTSSSLFMEPTATVSPGVVRVCASTCGTWERHCQAFLFNTQVLCTPYESNTNATGSMCYDVINGN